MSRKVIFSPVGSWTVEEEERRLVDVVLSDGRAGEGAQACACSPRNAPMCCVMPPASVDATWLFLRLSNRVVFP